MRTILLISTPSSILTYEDGDVISALDGNTSPGTSVESNVSGCWSFLYVSDKEHTDTEMTDLLQTDSSGVDETYDIIHKRRYFLTLPGDASSYTTYYDYDEAPSEMKKTWADVSGLISDKQE